MGLVSPQFAVIASASSTGVVNTNNRRWAVINNVQQTLAGAERSGGVAAFADVAILDDEDYRKVFEQRRDRDLIRDRNPAPSDDPRFDPQLDRALEQIAAPVAAQT